MPNLLATLGQQYEIIAGTGIAEPKSVTFDGGSISSVGAHTLFKVTGLVDVKIYAFCENLVLSGSGTLEVGTATSTAGLIAQTTASQIAANEIWHDNAPDKDLELSTVSTAKLISSDIILTVGTDTIDGGTINFTCVWSPRSAGAQVTATSASASVSASPSPSASLSPSASVSRSVSPSTSASPSLSPSSSLSPSASVSLSISRSLSPSASVSPSASLSRSLSPSSSVSPSASASRSLSPSSSVSPSASV